MSPVAKMLLIAADNSMTIDLDRVLPLFPRLNRGQLKVIALHIGLRIQGGS